jgi:hypothetical protein
MRDACLHCCRTHQLSSRPVFLLLVLSLGWRACKAVELRCTNGTIQIMGFSVRDRTDCQGPRSRFLLE